MRGNSPLRTYLRPQEPTLGQLQDQGLVPRRLYHRPPADPAGAALDDVLRQAAELEAAQSAPPALMAPASPAPRRPEEYIAEVMSRPQPVMPEMAPPRMQMPRRRQQSAWAQILPQALSGIGDVVTGGQTNYLGRTMGLQRAQQDQAYQDDLAAASALYDAQRVDYDHDWRKYGAAQKARENEVSQTLRLAEASWLRELMEKQRGTTGERERQNRRDAFVDRLMGAETAEDLRLEANKLKALYPEHAETIDEAAAGLIGAMEVQRAHEESQPNALQEQIESTIGKGPSSWVGERVGETIVPMGGKGLPFFGARRGYRWLYPTIVGAPFAGAADLGEAAGIWDLSGGHAQGGLRAETPAPTPEAIEQATREWQTRPSLADQLETLRVRDPERYALWIQHLEQQGMAPSTIGPARQPRPAMSQTQRYMGGIRN